MVQQLIELAPGVLARLAPVVPDAGLVREHPDASAAVLRGAAPASSMSTRTPGTPISRRLLRGTGLEHECPEATQCGLRSALQHTTACIGMRAVVCRRADLWRLLDEIARILLPCTELTVNEWPGR